MRVDGVQLAYDDEGRGQTVVCLHAVGHGAGDFAGFRVRHADRCRVLALDWPDHGRSAADREPPSSQRYATLLEGVLEALALDRVVLLGNSIGGAAALRVAAGRPDRVRGVIACNPGGLVAHGVQKRVFTAAVAAFFARGARRGRWSRRGFAALYDRVLSEPPAAEQRARIVATWPEVAPLLAAAWRGFGRQDEDLTPLLSRIACPALVTWSTGDRLNPLSFNRRGIAALPAGELVTFRGGHAPFLECPREFDAVFAGFLERLT